MPRLSSSVVFSSLALLLACAPRLSTAQDLVEVKSENFSVYTDAGEGKGQEVARRFEEMRAAFGAFTREAHVTLPVPLQILAFRNARDMEYVAPVFNGKPVLVGGLFALRPDKAFIAIHLGSQDWGVAFHEYAHLLIHGNMPPVPAWYDEGFADYCSSLRVGKKEIELGHVPPWRVRVLSSTGWMKLADLLAVSQDSRLYNEGAARDLFYAQSWITVHYIFAAQKTQELVKYLELTQAKKVPIEEAIRQSFHMEPRQLEAAVHQYFEMKRMTYFVVPTNVLNFVFETAQLSIQKGFNRICRMGPSPSDG